MIERIELSAEKYKEYVLRGYYLSVMIEDMFNKKHYRYLFPDALFFNELDYHSYKMYLFEQSKDKDNFHLSNDTLFWKHARIYCRSGMNPPQFGYSQEIKPGRVYRAETLTGRIQEEFESLPPYWKPDLLLIENAPFERYKSEVHSFIDWAEVEDRERVFADQILTFCGVKISTTPQTGTFREFIFFSGKDPFPQIR